MNAGKILVPVTKISFHVLHSDYQYIFLPLQTYYFVPQGHVCPIFFGIINNMDLIKKGNPC